MLVLLKSAGAVFRYGCGCGYVNLIFGAGAVIEGAGASVITGRVQTKNICCCKCRRGCGIKLVFACILSFYR